MKFKVKKEELERDLWKYKRHVPIKNVIKFIEKLPEEIELEGEPFLESIYD